MASHLRPLVLAALLLGACAHAPLRGEPPRLLDSPAARPERPSAPGSAFLPENPRLGDLLRVAMVHSPRIRAASARAAAAGEAAAAEGWLPDPRAVVGWYETAVETRVGPQRWSVSLQQSIPFPTKLSLKSDIQAVEARRARLMHEQVVRDVLLEVVHTAHELAYLDEAAHVSAEIGALLERYVAAAAADTASPLLSELFRAETQRAQLDNDRVVLAELRTVEEQRLRSLLGLDPHAAVGATDPGPVPRVAASLDDLLRRAERTSQELEDAGLALDTATLRTSLARSQPLPELMVGVTRIATDRLDPGLGMDPDGNGRDPVIVQMGVSLPIWVGRDQAELRKARDLERAAALDRDAAVHDVRYRVARAWFRVGAAERLHRLYAETLVPRAKAAARTAEDLLAAGKGSMAGLLETVAVFHNFRLAAARARADHGQAVAELERVIGEPFAVSDEETP